MKKIFLLLFALCFLAVKPVFAADMTITCTASSCESSPLGNPPLFVENNWAPGETMTKTISVINQNSGDDCNLYLALKNKKQTPADFASRIFTVIKQGVEDIFGIRNGPDYASSNKTMQDLYDSGTIFLKTIPFGQTMDFGWTATFDSVTGNYYQGAKTTFDFDLNFTCGIEPAPTSTPVPTATPIPGPNPTSAPPPGCNDSVPGIPTGLYAVAGPGTGQVTLYWTAPARPYTYFYVGYSDNTDWPPKWGNPDVGDTSSYTVSGLGAGTYWFWVRAGNGCMPGDFAGPVSPGTIAGISTGGIAEGFKEDVLGAQEGPEGGLNGGISSEEGTLVEGAKTEKVCPFWWIVLIVQTILLALYYWKFTKQGNKLPRKWGLVAGILVLIAYLVDRYAHTHWFVPSKMCPWEIWLGSLAAILETAGFKFLRNQKA